ncbi:MAG: hypothetical protein V1734_00085 [Nanoarchaeota archaeon]
MKTKVIDIELTDDELVTEGELNEAIQGFKAKTIHSISLLKGADEVLEAQLIIFYD